MTVSGGVLRRTPPAGHPSSRSHTFRVAVGDQSGWVTHDAEGGREAAAPGHRTGRGRAGRPLRRDLGGDARRRDLGADAGRADADPHGHRTARGRVDCADEQPPRRRHCRHGRWSTSPRRRCPMETSDAAVTLVRRSVDRLASVAGPDDPGPAPPRLSHAGGDGTTRVGAPARSIPGRRRDRPRRRCPARLAQCGRAARRRRDRPRPALADPRPAGRAGRHRPR